MELKDTLADDVKVPLKPAHQKQNLTMKVGTVQPHVLTAEVMVTFDPCPPGYYLNHSSYLCIKTSLRMIQYKFKGAQDQYLFKLEAHMCQCLGGAG